MKNYYVILGLQEYSSIDEIKKAYHKLAKEFHPDNNGIDGEMNQEEYMCLINEAYDTLSNVDRKRIYDEELRISKSKSIHASNEQETKDTRKEQNFDEKQYCDRAEDYNDPSYNYYKDPSISVIGKIITTLVGIAGIVGAIFVIVVVLKYFNVFGKIKNVISPVVDKVESVGVEYFEEDSAEHCAKLFLVYMSKGETRNALNCFLNKNEYKEEIRSVLKFYNGDSGDSYVIPIKNKVKNFEYQIENVEEIENQVKLKIKIKNINVIELVDDVELEVEDSGDYSDENIAAIVDELLSEADYSISDTFEFIVVKNDKNEWKISEISNVDNFWNLMFGGLLEYALENM